MKDKVLSDDIVCRIEVPKRARRSNWPREFGNDGKIYCDRPNRGSPANLMTNGREEDLVYRGYYILHGDAGTRGL